MRRGTLASTLTICSCALAAGLATAAPGGPVGVASSSPAPAEVVAVVAARARTSDGLAAKTELRRIAIGRTGDVRTTPLATLAHPADAVVRGDVVERSGRFLGVAVVADERPGNPDFGAALSFFDASGAARRLLAGVAFGSRPLAGDDGLLYVQRGFAGILPTPAEAKQGRLRVDALEIDAVDPASGAVRVVFTWQGYITHIAGALGSELVVYRVGPLGADLVRVDRTSGKARVVAAVPPFARDFTVDASRRAVVLSNRDASDVDRWVVDRVDLDTGARTEIAAARGDAPTPFALADGSIAYTAPARAGLVFDRAPARVFAPLGAGHTYVTHATSDGAWLALAHVPNERAFDAAALYARSSGRVVALGSKSERVDVVGLLGAQSGALR